MPNFLNEINRPKVEWFDTDEIIPTTKREVLVAFKQTRGCCFVQCEFRETENGGHWVDGDFHWHDTDGSKWCELPASPWGEEPEQMTDVELIAALVQQMKQRQRDFDIPPHWQKLFDEAERRTK